MPHGRSVVRIHNSKNKSFDAYPCAVALGELQKLLVILHPALRFIPYLLRELHPEQHDVTMGYHRAGHSRASSRLDATVSSLPVVVVVVDEVLGV